MKKGGKGNIKPQVQSQPQPPPKKQFNPEDYVSQTASLDVVLEIRAAFEIFDQDGSGYINPTELKEAFVNLGFAGQSKLVSQIMARLDEDKSGSLDFGEFMKLATAKISEKDSKADIMKVFNAFDSNKAGKFTITDFKKVAREVGADLMDDELDHIFHKTDLDGDGFVTADDFYNVITQRIYNE